MKDRPVTDHDRATGAFDGVDFDGFWDDSDYSLENYTEPAPGASLIAEVEQELGFRLPDSFVELAKIHNGGAVIKGKWIAYCKPCSVLQY